MRKIISMLLAVSMSLSVMCSSFTAAAVDGNDTAVQTDSSPAEFSSLFGDELNEKAAALSDDYGITSVEVNVSDGTAKVSYHAVSDCTVIVGIYEDDGTDTGTHMLTFGTAAVSAGNTVGTVAINESLPEYFYVKAYVVEQSTFKPLAKEYTTPNYTKAVQDFLGLTISDFIDDGYDDDHILNLDGSDSNNFMVFDKRAKILNFDTQISVDDLTLTSSTLTVKQNGDAEPNIANLKKGDPFLFFTTNGVLAGVASSVSYNGSSAVINYTDATTADVFDHIRIDTSDITPRRSAAAYSARSNNRTTNVYPLEREFSWTEEIKTPGDDDNKPIFGASGSMKLSAAYEGSVTISYSSGYKELVAELSITPSFTIEFTGEGHISKEFSKDESIPIVGTGAVNLVSLKFEIVFEPKAQISASAKATFSTTITAKVDTNKSFSDMVYYKDKINTPQLEVGGEVEIELGVSFSVGLAVLEVDLGESKALFNLDLVASLTPDAKAGTSAVLGDSMKHLCKPMTCFDGELSVNVGIAIVAKSKVLEILSNGSLSQKTPLGTLEWEEDKISLTVAEREMLPEEIQEFNIKLNPLSFSWGKCEEYAYRTYFYAEDALTGDRIQDVLVYTKDLRNGDPKYSEDITNRGGRAVLYIKPDERIKIGYGDTKNTYKDTEIYINIAEPEEEFVEKMDIGVPPTYIDPRPTEPEKVPKFLLGENLRYNKLMVQYGTFGEERTYYIDFTEDMIKSFDPTTLGRQTLIIEYNGKTWEKEIEIVEDERHIDSISINTPPKKTDYDIGDDFDVTGLTINAKFKDGTESDRPISVPAKWVSGFDNSTAGEKTLTVTYTDKYKDTATAEFTVTVGKGTVEKIEMASLPQKTEYTIGEALSLDGAQIRIIYADGSEPQIKTVTSDMVSGYERITAGEKTITVTYKDTKGKTHTTEFTVTVNAKEVEKIEIAQLLDQNKYCQINGSLNLKKAIIKVYNADGTLELIQITEDMISGFDSSTLGIFPVTVTYGGKIATYDVEVVENLKKVCRIYLDCFIGGGNCLLTNDGVCLALFADDAMGSPYIPNLDNYTIREYHLDGSASPSIRLSFTTIDENNNLVYTDEYGGKVKVSNFDRTEVGIHEVTANYYSPDGNLDPSVKSSSVWISVVPGKSIRWDELELLDENKDYLAGISISHKYGYPYYNDPKKTGTFSIGDNINFSDFYYSYSYIRWFDSINPPDWLSIGSDTFESEKDPDTGWYKVKPGFLLSDLEYLGGFDSSYPTDGYAGIPDVRYAYFNFDGHVIHMDYRVRAYDVTGTETASYSNFNDYAAFADYGADDRVYEPEFTDETETPDVTEAPEETEIPDSTEPVVTELQPEETTESETAAVEETPVFGIDSSGIFGFGRAAAKKSAQYANLHKNDIYNYYVVKSASADILGKDNLLFVGQASSDGNGSLSFEYETTTGEDGTIILKPMSDDTATPGNPNTPDNPSQPTVPGNSGSSSNTGLVIPVGGTKTETMTVKVENKVTGKTSKARAQKTGNSVSVKLGTENDGYYANVYTTDGEYICSAVIENGRAEFNVPDGLKLSIVIDEFAYGEDVSSAAGVFGDSASKSLPYAAITVVIAVVGIYFKKRSEKKIK